MLSAKAVEVARQCFSPITVLKELPEKGRQRLVACKQKKKRENRAVYAGPHLGARIARRSAGFGFKPLVLRFPEFQPRTTFTAGQKTSGHGANEYYHVIFWPFCKPNSNSLFLQSISDFQASPVFRTRQVLWGPLFFASPGSLPFSKRGEDSSGAGQSVPAPKVDECQPEEVAPQIQPRAHQRLVLSRAGQNLPTIV